MSQTSKTNMAENKKDSQNNKVGSLIPKTKGNVFAFCAHSDDQILGAGGSLAKLSEEGYDVYVIVLSAGQKANPLTKTKFTIKTRRDESLKANEIIKAKELFFFDLSEGKFLLEYKLKDTFSKLVKILREYKPVKIFTHAPDDVHIDHRNSLTILLDIINSLGDDYKPDVFSFDVWNIFNLKSNSYPVIYINISKQIRKKSQAISCFKSQKISMISLLAKMYLEMLFNGIKTGTLFAEKFYKIM
ncbi:MAG TPA: PIG-L family deacetylase [Candidatus Woesearchaeota archaeon]|nr:PIG-L family deacetylase [Candidatus Woesearchaeota archaeon]